MDCKAGTYLKQAERYQTLEHQLSAPKMPLEPPSVTPPVAGGVPGLIPRPPQEAFVGLGGVQPGAGLLPAMPGQDPLAAGAKGVSPSVLVYWKIYILKS